MTTNFLKLHPANFVPITRTPWAGSAIAEIKRKYAPDWGCHVDIPPRIGESWEVSTDPQFPSTVRDGLTPRTLGEFLSDDEEDRPFGTASRILGENSANRMGNHCPLLLKWIEASTLLSAQVHPNHDHPRLASNECGKPEAWLVLSVKPGAFVYLGFRSGISSDDIVGAIERDDLKSVLHKVEPKPFDYISIPTGCVHALGPGVLVAEPQCVLPGKSGKTWRISDWKRRYNAKGEEDPAGLPRELHCAEGVSAIDWSLPRGEDLERFLIRSMVEESRFSGDKINPCALHLITKQGRYPVEPLIAGEFMLATQWQGRSLLRSETTGETLSLFGGESAIIGAECGRLSIEAAECHDESPGLALFALRQFTF